MKRSRSSGAALAPAGSTTEPAFELNDEQWLQIADLFPESPRSPLGGRPPAESRLCFEGICWVLRTGARWKDLPRCFPSSRIEDAGVEPHRPLQVGDFQMNVADADARINRPRILVGLHDAYSRSLTSDRPLITLH